MRTGTHSPADSKFCFSSFLIRGRPGFILSGEVGVFWAAGWMKWANNSVCFNRYSNLLVRSVCCITQKEHPVNLLTQEYSGELCHDKTKIRKKKKKYTYHFLLITWSRIFSFGGRRGGGILSISTCIWRGLFSSIWRVRLLLNKCIMKTKQSCLVDSFLIFTPATDRKRQIHWLTSKPVSRRTFQSSYLQKTGCVTWHNINSSFILSDEGTFESTFTASGPIMTSTHLLHKAVFAINQTPLIYVSELVNLNL